ncbi:hypothetical protein GCM10027275_29330 [Rhabdobacter roseus]|uniref:Outer membrane protein beta-barrel domain-containing protein n=1 Tax=Rhabdobacter roseus TaxID=1655419 RepID=A0A840TT98_9BACT|nr:outer membrane beta-barrel protein [Rhabdobacter roseus]MBB5284887.1 hypothetical protein [Rhabdobacter roseus]
MKKCFFCLLLLAGTSFSAWAQTEPGTWLVGLSGNGAIRKQDFNRNTQLQATPLVGYFVRKNLALGGQVAWDHFQRGSSGFQFTYKSSTMNANALARLYFGEGKLKPYGTLLGGYAWSWRDVPYLLPVNHGGIDGWNAAVGAGGAYFVAPQVALEGQVDYRFLNNGDVKQVAAFRLGFALYLP